MEQNLEETTSTRNIDVASAALCNKTLLAFINLKFGIKSKYRLWHKRVPYEFDKAFSNPEFGLNDKILIITKAIELFNKMTKDNSIPLVFSKKHENDEDYVRFAHHQERTNAIVGRQSHVNIVNVADWANVKEVLHEMMHVLGFQHEHQRGDIEIKLSSNNISENENENINHDLDEDIIKRLGVPLAPYDPKSIMHYPNVFLIGANSYRLDCRRLVSIKNEQVTSLPLLIPARPPDSPNDEEIQYTRMIEVMMKIAPYIDNLEPRHFEFIYRRPDNQVQCVLAQEQNSTLLNIPSSVSWDKLFTNSDIYGLELIYGQGKCNRCLSEERFVQAHSKCECCNKIVCVYCAYTHHRKHLDENSFKLPKQQLLTEEELQEFEVKCNCSCLKLKDSVLTKLKKALESLLTWD